MPKRTVIQQRLTNGLQYTIAACLFLTCSLYFLVDSGSANSFPTYLTALAFIPFLVLKPQFFQDLDGPVFSLAAMLLVYMAISVAWSGSDESVVQHLGFALLVIAFSCSVALILVEFPHMLRWLLLAVLGAALINAAYSLYLHYSLPEHNPLPEPRLYALGRLNNPVVSGLSYGFALILCGYLMMTTNSNLRRVLLIASALLLVIVVTLSWTRGVWLALGVALSIGAVTQYSTNRKLLLIALSIIAGVIAVALLLGLGTDVLFKRAWSFRPEIWAEFISRTLESNLLIGVGLTSDSVFHLSTEPEPFKHPHSLFVSTFYYAGLVGLLMYFTLLALSVKKLLQIAPSNLRTLAAMCLAYGITATLVDGNELLVKVNYVWLLIWFPVGLLLAKNPAGNIQDL